MNRVTPSPTPRLTVTSRVIAKAPAFAEILAPGQPLLWRRRGAGIVGYGEAARLEFSGPARLEEAAAAWRSIVTEATVIDEVGIPSSGLVALTTFAFSSDSAVTSVLVVPRLLVGRRDGVTWVTTVGVDDEEAPEARVPDAVAITSPAQVRLVPGQMSEDDYQVAVRGGLERIRAGDVSKVVLARDLVGELNAGGDVRSMVQQLIESYPDCWTFAIDGFYGASPETLVRVIGGSVEARVLAGTAARGADPDSDDAAAVDLATSRKDLDEHAFAVRSVADALAPLTTNLVAEDAPFTLKLANLWHLATDMSADLTPGVTCLDLVAVLHPTAAVAGTPTDRALTLIDELEPFDRGRYAGPVGWVGGNGEGEFAIALRCVQVDGSRVTAHAGAGIVADSNPATELRETTIKFRPVVEALAPQG